MTTVGFGSGSYSNNTHSTKGKVDNERPLCPYPKQAVYTGPQGGQNDPANWVAANFTCRELAL